jgi:threonine dehydrogenase-like Zn-dependent dehydrogenase
VSFVFFVVKFFSLSSSTSLIKESRAMKQLTFIEAGKLEWWDVEEPQLQSATDVLVRPLAVARCDLDYAILAGKAPFIGPFPFGHEFVGEVVALGTEISSFKIGDRVIVPFQISCGSCTRCHHKLTNSCTTVAYRSMYGLGALGGEWGGALSDLVRVPFAENMLIPLPAGIAPATLASASDNIPDGWRTVGPYLEAAPDSSVLIVGGGAWSIGLYAVAVASALNAPKLDYLDTDPERLAIAESLGATVIQGPPKRRVGAYDITVDASAHAAGLACALRSTAVGGICTSVGIYYTDTTPMPLLDMYDTGVTFKIGRAHSRADLPRIVELVANGRFHPEKVTTKVAAWSDAVEALNDPSAKVVIVRD